jgi:hypothetical protein
MRGIDRSLVDDVWREIAAFPPGRTDAEARAFLAGQPDVAAYLGGVLAGQEPPVQRAAFGLVFLLFKVLERSLGRPFPPVTAARLGQAQEATARWLAEHPAPATAVLAGPEPGHPTLAHYILGVFYGDDEGAVDYDEGVRARLTLVLRTLAGAVDLGEVES